MADANSTVTVDGVEPSILVKLLNISDNPERVKIFTSDDGTERYIYKENEEPVLVTSKDLGALGSVGIEILAKPELGTKSSGLQPEQSNTPEGTIITPVNPPIGPTVSRAASS